MIRPPLLHFVLCTALGMLLAALVVMVLTGCSTTRGPYSDLSGKQTTPLGIVCRSSSALTDAQLDDIDTHFVWAKKQGLQFDADEIVLNIVDGQLTPGGNWGVPDTGSPTGWDAGKVVRFNGPVEIDLVKPSLVNLRHEFLHVILFNRTSDSDAGHALPIWRELGVY